MTLTAAALENAYQQTVVQLYQTWLNALATGAPDADNHFLNGLTLAAQALNRTRALAQAVPDVP